MYDLIWFDLIWFDLIWFDLIWFDLIWFDLFICFMCIPRHLGIMGSALYIYKLSTYRIYDNKL